MNSATGSVLYGGCSAGVSILIRGDYSGGAGNFVNTITVPVSTK
jgi:hypothetical protein